MANNRKTYVTVSCVVCKRDFRGHYERPTCSKACSDKDQANKRK